MRPKETPSRVWYLGAELEQRQVSIEATVTSSRFAVVGAGRLGASLALALCAHGLSLTGYTAGSDAGRARAEQWLGLPAAAHLRDLVGPDPDMYFICVPDGSVADAAAELAAALTADRASAPVQRTSAAPVVVAHTSGVTSVSVLAPCESAGAATLAFHPLQTFAEPLSGASRFAGAGVALTPGAGRADAAGTLGFKLADILGMRPFLLDDGKRSLYHAAATVACNYLVTLEYLADDLFKKAGVPERVTLELFLPLVAATLDNIAARGPVDALTGPLSRGDAQTISAHMQSLVTDAPDAIPVYRALGEATLELVGLRGELEPAVLARLRELLTGPASTPRPEAL